mgnify:CR=1 FL=1
MVLGVGGSQLCCAPQSRTSLLEGVGERREAPTLSEKSGHGMPWTLRLASPGRKGGSSKRTHLRAGGPPLLGEAS